MLHDTVLLVSVHTEDVPRVDDTNRAVITELGEGIQQVRFNYGFMEDPDIPAALAAHPGDPRRRHEGHLLPRARVGDGRQGAGHASLA